MSPFEGHTRTVQSTRPAFLTVLRGGAIGAEVGARRLSGEAPFTAVFKLALNDRQDYRATGDVVWDVSSDGGATWESTTPEERYKYQLVKVFQKGQVQGAGQGDQPQLQRRGLYRGGGCDRLTTSRSWR